MGICMAILFTENAYYAQPAKTPNYSPLLNHFTPATSPISTVLIENLFSFLSSSPFT